MAPLCEGIRPLSRMLVEVGTSTGVERGSGWFYWMGFGEVWIVILLSDSQFLSKSTYPGFIYAGFICVWAEVALLGHRGYIQCVNGFVMLFACDMDQLPAEKSRTNHQCMLCFGCWCVESLPYYCLARFFYFKIYFFIVFSVITIGQCRADRKRSGRGGGRDQERSLSRDSYSGCL